MPDEIYGDGWEADWWEDLMDDLAICEGDQCPYPRRGPFIHTEEWGTLCRYCFRVWVLEEDALEAAEKEGL